MMYSWGSTRQFSRIIQFRPLALKLGIYGFYDVRNKNILMKKSWNVELRVYMSIFPKTSNWFPDLEIPVIRFFRRRKHEGSCAHLRVWRSIFSKFQFTRSKLKLVVSGFETSGSRINRWEIELNVEMAKLKFFWKSTCRPSILHRRNFSLPNSCSAGFKTPKYQFWAISIFLGKFSGFFQTDPYTLKGWPEDFFFSKKSCTILKNLFCPNFSCLSAIQTK